jgi:hypothetical protein
LALLNTTLVFFWSAVNLDRVVCHIDRESFEGALIRDCRSGNFIYLSENLSDLAYEQIRVRGFYIRECYQLVVKRISVLTHRGCSGKLGEQARNLGAHRGIERDPLTSFA